MKQGQSLQELSLALQEQLPMKRDFLAGTPNLAMSLAADKLLFVDSGNEYGITDHTHAQIAGRLGIPKRYYDRLREEYPDIVAHDVNELFRRKPEVRMVRTLGERCRAFLSEKFRALDNHDLAEAVLPSVIESGCEVVSCALTETRMYIKAVSKRLREDVQVGDTVQQGVVISNSEVGQGALRVESMLYRLVCSNGMIQGYAKRRNHVGRKNVIEDYDTAEEFMSRETQRLDDLAFWAKTKDAVKHILSEQHFAKQMLQLQIAANKAVESPPIPTVEVVAARFSLQEGEKESVLQHLVSGGDLTVWGYANAVTRASQDVDDYARATELEKVGGGIVELGEQDWDVMCRQATKQWQKGSKDE